LVDADEGEMASPGIGLSQFAFVGSFLAAVKKTIGGASREEPPEHLRCAITQELFSDPVILTQTGYTYERRAIQRWLAAKFPPTDPTSNVELYCTDIVPNWALRQSVEEWARANGYGSLEPPEEAMRCTKDGRPVTRRSASATSAAALTQQYIETLHRSHPRHAAVLIFLLTFTIATATAMAFTVAHTVLQAIRYAANHRVVQFLVRSEHVAVVQSFVWWGGVALFLWLANTPAGAAAAAATTSARRAGGARATAGGDVVGRSFMRRAGAR
jgi:hypothetical protein